MLNTNRKTELNVIEKIKWALRTRLKKRHKQEQHYKQEKMKCVPYTRRAKNQNKNVYRCPAETQHTTARLLVSQSTHRFAHFKVTDSNENT
jgi:hypothetical protein